MSQNIAEILNLALRGFGVKVLSPLPAPQESFGVCRRHADCLAEVLGHLIKRKEDGFIYDPQDVYVPELAENGKPVFINLLLLLMPLVELLTGEKVVLLPYISQALDVAAAAQAKIEEPNGDLVFSYKGRFLTPKMILNRVRQDFSDVPFDHKDDLEESIVACESREYMPIVLVDASWNKLADLARITDGTAIIGLGGQLRNFIVSRGGQVVSLLTISPDCRVLTIDDALICLTEAKRQLGGDSLLILSLTDSGIEDVSLEGMRIVQEDGNSYVEVCATMPNLAGIEAYE